MPVNSGAARFVRQQLDRAAARFPDQPIATVTAIAAGAGTDGQAVVTVNYCGSSLQLPHMAHYTPVVGDVVPLIRVSGQWVIAGRPVGFPQPPN